jgi:hypothetical protein
MTSYNAAMLLTKECTGMPKFRYCRVSGDPDHPMVIKIVKYERRRVVSLIRLDRPVRRMDR